MWRFGEHHHSFKLFLCQSSQSHECTHFMEQIHKIAISLDNYVNKQPQNPHLSLNNFIKYFIKVIANVDAPHLTTHRSHNLH